MAYGVVRIRGEAVEVCDECGFNGSRVPADELARRLGDLGDAWRLELADEETARTRPSPATWCAVEYCVHTVFVVRANEWQARRIVAGQPTALTLLPPEIGSTDPGDMREHACGAFGLTAAIDDVTSALRSLAAYTAGLTEDELRAVGALGGIDSLQVDTLGVVRHVLHDAEHHLLDVQRASAGKLLAGPRIL